RPRVRPRAGHHDHRGRCHDDDRRRGHHGSRRDDHDGRALIGPTMTPSLLAEIDPIKRLEACGPEPGNVCRFVYDQTESVGLAEAGNWLTGTPLRILCVVIGSWIL